ncbi:MAG: ATP-binding protein [Holophagae bacterium]|jgi:signal transduction histidine kinase/signal recognition particle receptor subunit beta
MVQFDNQYRQIKVKIVYYGPALGGKTTCLHYIHRVTDPQRRTRLYSLNTASDRTLFFDLLSLDLGRIRGYRLTLQLYTVPGQVQYNATRRAVLAGADGIVFVADSQSSQQSANRESLANLEDNLRANGVDLEAVPLVMQYNKRDLSDLVDVDRLEAELNPDDRPFFPTVAITGDGVMEAFANITETTLVSLADRLGLDVTGDAVERLERQVRSALEPYLTASTPSRPPDDVEVTVPEGSPDETGPLSAETLVSEAVRANLAMTDLSSRLETVSRQLQRKALVTRAITDFGRTIAHQCDPADVLRLLAKAAVTHLKVQAAAVLIGSSEDELREAVVHGFDRDPLLAAATDGTTLAGALVRPGEPMLLARDLEGVDPNPAQRAIEVAGFASAVVVPLSALDRLLGALLVYRGADREPLDEHDLELATILGGTAAMGYANALAFRQLDQTNRDLEAVVERRTAELQRALDEMAGLNRELQSFDATKDELIERLAGRLREPVASLVTAVGALDRLGDAPPDKVRRVVDVIRRQADTLSQATESLAQASLMVTDRTAPGREPTPLADLLRRSVSPLKDLARKLGVDIKLMVPGGLDSIVGDPEALAAAVRAVVKNAIEHTRPAGEVRIEVRRVVRGDEPWLELKVSDTGHGIDEADLPHVFDPFWQGAVESDVGGRGLGLGLVIARQVIERHGGRVTIAPRDPEGTVVSLVLPQ